MIPCKSSVKEVLFEWSRHGIFLADFKGTLSQIHVRTRLTSNILQIHCILFHPDI